MDRRWGGKTTPAKINICYIADKPESERVSEEEKK